MLESVLLSLAGAVVGVYGVTIEKFVILAVFLPIIASQGGNAGMQTVTVIVRDMALGELSPGDGRKALFKELLLGLLIGTIIGRIENKGLNIVAMKMLTVTLLLSG